VKVFFSDQSPARKDVGRHYDTLDPMTKKAINEWCEQYGYDPLLFRTHYGWRDHANISFFRRCLDRPDPLFRKKDMTIFY